MKEAEEAYHFKQNPNKLLGLPSPLGGEGGGGDIKKCGAAFRCHRFGQHGLTSARGAHH